jgi:hypothetical protein
MRLSGSAGLIFALIKGVGDGLDNYSLDRKNTGGG